MGRQIKAIARMIDAAVIAVVIVFFASGCGGERADQPQKQNADKAAVSVDKVSASSDKIAALEKDVAKLRNEVQQLRHRIEVDARMRSRHGMPSYQPLSGAGGPDGSRNGEFRSRHFTRRNDRAEMRDNPAAERQDPATMTPEQRRAWHEERRKMREERRKKMLEERNREKVSEPGKQTTTNKKG